MDLQQILFSFSGRIPRKIFWLYGIGSGVILGGLSGVLMSVAEHAGSGMFDPTTHRFHPSGGYAVAMFILSVAQTWINLALVIKRLHDRDRTGWWIVAQIAAVVAAVLLVMVTTQMPDWQKGTGMAVSGAAIIVAAALSLWLFVETGLLRGTSGPNRFGPDPLGPNIADASL